MKPKQLTSAAKGVSVGLTERESKCYSLSPRFEKLVLQCLAKESADRPESATLLEQILADCACSAQWSWQQFTDCWRERGERGQSEHQ
jgi:hypothetical protein